MCTWSLEGNLRAPVSALLTTAFDAQVATAVFDAQVATAVFDAQVATAVLPVSLNTQSHELTRRYRVRVLAQILEGVLPLVAQVCAPVIV